MQNSTRAAMVRGAIQLLATRGFHGASLGNVLAPTGMPRGSVYHHFPGGKDELIDAALVEVGRYHDAWLTDNAGTTPREVVAAFLEFWRRTLLDSDLEAGCPILAVTVSVPEGPLLQRAGAVFRGSERNVAELLASAGLEPGAAARFATVMIAAAEGAVVLARAQRDMAAFETVAEHLLATTPAPAGGQHVP